MDIVAAVEQGRYVSMDVVDTLSTFMVNDQAVPARFLKVADNLIAAAAKASSGESPRVAICGECAHTLCEQGNADAAVEVEHLCDEIAKNCNVEILCAYVLSSLQSEQQSRHLREDLREASGFPPR